MNGVPSHFCRSFIKAEEGVRLTAYGDEGGKLTIGWGHTGPDVYAGQTISLHQAEQLFNADLAAAAEIVNQSVDAKTLTQNQFDALTAFTFNVGGAAFRGSTLASLVRSRPNNPAIRYEFSKWNKYNCSTGCRISQGLTARRRREADLYFSGALSGGWPWVLPVFAGILIFAGKK